MTKLWKLLALVATVVGFTASVAFGQNPSFKSFEPTQFSTNGFVIRITAQAFSGTNVLGNVYVTNLFVTNITVNGTLVVSNSTVLTLINVNTNQFNTNQFSTDGKISLQLGTTPHVPYWDGVWLGDTAMIRDSTNSVAVQQANVGTVLVTNLNSGGIVFASTNSGQLAIVPDGIGYLQNRTGINGGYSWSTNFSTTINPTDTFIPYRSNATTFGDSPIYLKAPSDLWMGATNGAIELFTDSGYAEATLYGTTSGSFLDISGRDGDGLGNGSYVIIQDGVISDRLVSITPYASPVESPFYFSSRYANTNAAFFFGVENPWSASHTNIVFGISPYGDLIGKRVPSAPSAPNAGNYTLFAIDNGGGKMVLKVQFPTGAAQVIATEP